MNKYQVHCPSCHTSFQASDEHVGASTQCQNCQSYFTIPTREQAIILTPTQQPDQAATVPKWYKTLTIMGPLCACLLLIGGGVVYWIINNRTKTINTDVYDTDMISKEAPTATPEPEKQAEVSHNIENPKEETEVEDENPTEWTEWWLRDDQHVPRFRQKSRQGYLGLDVQIDWKKNGNILSARYLFMKLDEEDSSLRFAQWWGDKTFLISKHRQLIANNYKLLTFRVIINPHNKKTLIYSGSWIHNRYYEKYSAKLQQKGIRIATKVDSALLK